ncbi:uncharacterized protein LOC113304458 [Papaver somniferum]|uniref:uncharacterized protein LOC113304458 n=1 Tax=Papaver somniferum TaxID=3469 RepID=UPI000E6FB733|nr:uncharacterized protein LOC113304458 [Papaver somniferum]XP_026409372.1 uncharacterized protein LOC113304458 [Papaver somniferum]
MFVWQGSSLYQLTSLMERELPDGVIVSEILTRVSLAALLRQFQWVCRDWHNCIHDSKFQLIHSQKTPVVASGFFVLVERSIENISDSNIFFPFNNDPSNPSNKNPSPSLDFLPSPVAIAGSSPFGSLLCCVTLDKLQTGKSIPMFYIRKPATREWRKIPNPKTRFPDVGMRIVVMQTYPTLQYKIVRISATSDVIKYCCELFDSVTWAWKRLPNLKSLSGLVDRFGAVLINGCLHWMNNRRQTHVFSIEQEKWNAIIHLPPDIVESELDIRYLLILVDGKIGVLISNREWTEVWVLENYYIHTSWKRKFRKDLRAISCEVGGVCLPLAMSSTGIIFMLCRCPNRRCCAITYNTNDDAYTSVPFPSDARSFLGFPFESSFCYI